MKNRTKEITHGALYLALIAVLLIINRQTGNILDGYLLWILPVPLILYTRNYSFKSGLILVLAAFLLSFFLCTLTTVFYVTVSLLVGLIYGIALKKGCSNNILLLIAICGSLIITFVTCVFFSSLSGYGIKEDIEMFNELTAYFNVSLPQGWDIKLLIYGVYIISGIIEGFLVHLITFFVFTRLKIPFPQFVNVDKLKMPLALSVLSVVIIPLYLYFFTLNMDSKISEIILLLASFIFLMGLFFGYLVILYFCRIYGQKGIMCCIVVLLIVIALRLMNFIPAGTGFYLLALTGILDGFLDIKERLRRK